MSVPTPELLRLGAGGTPALVWRCASPMRVAASTVLGGGIGERDWVINAQVDRDYARRDPERHLEELAAAAGCDGDGVGFLTAAHVDRRTRGVDGGVVVDATVGIGDPTWAAAPHDERLAAASRPGTINIVAFVPVALTDAALVNAVMTITEAKAQALGDRGVVGTGTPSDAVCVLAPVEAPIEPFAGPRSPVGSALARAVHAAVSDGIAYSAERTQEQERS